MGEDWTAEQWLQWLRRGPSDPIPSRHGLNDCAAALEQEVARLRAQIVRMAASLPAVPYDGETQ